MDKKRIIRLSEVNDVKALVGTAGKCDFDIDIGYAGFNRVIVDAKSLLGVFGLDLSQPLSVCYGGFDPRLERVLDEFEIA